jgi:hypothetical protein
MYALVSIVPQFSERQAIHRQISPEDFLESCGLIPKNVCPKQSSENSRFRKARLLKKSRQPLAIETLEKERD